MEQKNENKFLLFKIMAFEPGSTNFHILEEDTCHWQSISYQATLRFNKSLREVYSISSSLRMLKNIMKVLQSRF